jgi:cytochrome c-type biogenesis protein CcmH
MTLMFWLIASAMTISVVALLLWPLLRRTTVVAMGERENRLAVYRQQFAELEQDRKNGVLTDELYQQARSELERRLLDETGSADTAPAAARWQVNSRLVAVVVAIVVPLASVALYWTIGNPLAITHPSASAFSAQGNSDSDRMSAEGIESLLERLKKKLEQNPNDGVGWALLARSYVSMGRYSEAVTIYEKAASLIPDDAQLLADYADALGVVQGRTLEGKPELLIQQALKRDPQNVKALMMVGTVAFDRKQYADAARYWFQARANLPPDAEPEVLQELASAIEEATGLAGEKGTAATVKVAPAGPAAPAKQAGQELAIAGTVTLAPHLAGKGSPTDTLFVFAKAVEGPPMPVSIVRVMRKDLPFTFRLDDSTSPMPSRKLSDVGTVVIVARLSKSGEAMAKSGDLQGMSQPVKPGVNGINVVIDREIP